MDRKASRGRKKEKCGLAKNSDTSGRKTNRNGSEAEAPNSRHTGGVCRGTKIQEASCLNGSPRLDIGKQERIDGFPPEPPEGPRQCRAGNKIHKSEQTGHHGDETTHRNMETESISATEDDGAVCLQQLTPDQQQILLEKTELAELLEQTKRLQLQAAKCLHRKEENPAELDNRGYACKQSESSKSSKEMSQSRKESNKPTATAVLHERKAPLSSQAANDEWPNREDAEFSVLLENLPCSLRDNNKQLEENSELHHKKVELGVLLQTAKVLLEQSDLPELKQNAEEDLSFADNTCNVSFKGLDRAENLEAGTTNTECDHEQSENKSLLETLYEKADEITCKAKLFVDMVHEGKDLGSNETQSGTENPKLLSQNSELPPDKTDESPSKSLVQKVTVGEEDKALQAEKKRSLDESADCTEGDQEVKQTDDVEDGETLDQKLELQRLLHQARQLLVKVNSPLWTDSGTKEAYETLLEAEELSRTAEGKVAEREIVSDIDQKEEKDSQLPLEVTTSENELPSGLKNEMYFEGNESDKQMQTSGGVELQPKDVTDTTTHDRQPGASETAAADENAWSEVETTLLCEKNELTLLLMKTQLLQQKAEMIMTRTHVPMGKSDLKEIALAPSPNATHLSSEKTTEITSEMIKPDLEARGIFLKELKQPLDTTQQSSETTKEVNDTTPISSETTRLALETKELSSEKIIPKLEMTKTSSDATNSDLKTNQKSSVQNIQASDKISLSSDTTSQKLTKENVETQDKNSLKIGAEIPQEKQSTEENLTVSECTKYIDDIKHESNDLNHSDLRTEATLRENDHKTTVLSLSNNETSQIPSHDYEDSESSDEDDDPSYDPREELRLMLQRAKLLIEKSKIPVSERPMCPPPESTESSQQGNESDNPEPHTSETAAGKLADLSTNETEGSDPKKQTLNSEIRNKTDISLQETDNVQDEKQLSQDAEIEFLLARTKLMKLQADELINQLNVSEPKSDQQLPNSELSSESKVELRQNADKLDNQIKVSETEREQKSANTELPDEENKVLSSLESCTTSSSAQRREEESKDAEQPKRPTQLNLDFPTIEQIIGSRTIAPGEEIQSSSLPLNEDSQLELEEIEESQLEISENEKSQFEIEDEYLSDNSELSDMNMYYEDAEYSQDEEENLPDENNTISNENCLPQSQQQTEPDVRKDPYNEKRELELLLEITGLLLEKATLPLELIETIPNEMNLPTCTESVPETVEMIAKTDHAGEELNLSLHDTITVLETKQICSQKTETVTESTAMFLEKAGTIRETPEVPSQKTETVTESTAKTFEKTGTIIETPEVPSQDTETVAEKMAAMSLEKTGTDVEKAVPSHKTETVTETREISLKKTSIIAEMLPNTSKTQLAA